MENLIYFIKSGEQGFKSENHIKNFTKYLFSCSTQHTQNENTKLNFYIRKNILDNNFKIGFVNNNKELCNNFLTNYSSDFKNINNYKNDLNYIFFFILLNKKIITNLIEINNSQIEFLIEEEFCNLILLNYFDNNNDNFEKEIINICNFATKNNYSITNYNTINLDERKIIESQIHKQLIDEQSADNILIQISHHDQEDNNIFHIHRLIKVNN